MSEGPDAIVHGDVFEQLESLPDDYAHAAVVDYPWEFDSENGAGRYDGGNLYQTESLGKLTGVLDEMDRALVPGSWVFLFADDEIVDEVRALVTDSPLVRRQTAVWNRKSYSMGYYHRVQHYPIVTATVGDTDKKLTDRGTVYEAKKVQGAISVGTDEQTQKPVPLYRDLLAPPVLRDGERLLEPFAERLPATVCASRGGSTTGVARLMPRRYGRLVTERINRHGRDTHEQ